MGKYSVASVNSKDRIVCLHRKASNSFAHSNHTSLTHLLKTSDTIQMDSADGEGKHMQIITLD